MMHPRLRIERLRLAVGGRTLDLAAPAELQGGRVYLVQGPSGIGKSSLARILLGLGELVSPPMRGAGKVELRDALSDSVISTVLDGERYTHGSREFMAFLPQSGTHGFIDELGMVENATLFSRLIPKDAKPALESLAARLRIWPLPASLARASGGEKMRVSAVRALLPRSKDIKHPALVIADEPTAGLDPKAAHELSHALLEAARGPETIVLIITHDPSHFVSQDRLPESPGDLSIRITECTFDADGLLPIGEAAVFKVTSVGVGTRSQAMLKEGKSLAARVLETTGGFALAPVAFVMGLVKMPRRLVRPVAMDVLRTAFNPGTWAFVCGAGIMIAVTIGIFIFHLLPKRELIEPILLDKVLEGYGLSLTLMVLPMFAAVFTTAKNGAAHAARLSSSVRSGLLDTLALARMNVESYSLVPAVLGNIASLALTTFLCCFLGLASGAVVFMTAGSPLTIDQVMDIMFSGTQYYPDWMTWVIWKTLVSGAVAGVLTALFGLRPVQSERGVAAAVHGTLLWTMFAVLLVQCLFVVAQFGGSGL